MKYGSGNELEQKIIFCTALLHARGSLSANMNNGMYVLTLCYHHQEKYLADYLQHTFGGTSRVKKVLGKYGIWRRQYWIAYGNEAIGACQAMWPYIWSAGETEFGRRVWYLMDLIERLPPNVGLKEVGYRFRQQFPKPMQSSFLGKVQTYDDDLQV